MSAIIFKLKCITNMHVGSGDVNYKLVDNEVERDPVTEYPVIHASGVKGALREYFLRNMELQGDVDEIFGCNIQGQTSPGKLKFLEAKMLAIPARASCGDYAYYLVSTKSALDLCADQAKLFGDRSVRDAVSNRYSVKDRGVEGISLSSKIVLWGEEIHILDEDAFKKIPLPVIARNKLDNGISKNLWYEEIVPHESVFYFTVIVDDLPENQGLLNKFKGAVKDQIIQFGANASIGYGLCKVTVVEGKHE